MSVICTRSEFDSTIIDNVEIGKEWCKMYVCIDYYDKNVVRLSLYACFNMLGYRIEYDSKFGYVWFHLQHKIKYNLMLMSVNKNINQKTLRICLFIVIGVGAVITGEGGGESLGCRGQGGGDDLTILP